LDALADVVRRHPNAYERLVEARQGIERNLLKAKLEEEGTICGPCRRAPNRLLGGLTLSEALGYESKER
jgi:hypothetical protein